MNELINEVIVSIKIKQKEWIKTEQPVTANGDKSFDGYNRSHC